MRAKVFRSSLVFVTAMALVIGFTFSPAMAEKKFGLADIPEIKNRTPIHVIFQAGGESDVLIPKLKEFAAKTGLKCTGARKNGQKKVLIPPHLLVDFCDPS
jgi:hypothetical protein